MLPGTGLFECAFTMSFWVTKVISAAFGMEAATRHGYMTVNVTAFGDCLMAGENWIYRLRSPRGDYTSGDGTTLLI